MNPKVEVNLVKLKENVNIINKSCRDRGIEIAAVTKVFCAMDEISELFYDAGVKYLADSRLDNLKKLEKFNCPKIMLRLPMISEVEDLVKYADISLNSELETVKALNKAAKKVNKVHGVIYMVDLGDLREGFIEVNDLYGVIEETKDLENIRIIGIGTNLTCYGGVIPDENNLGKLGEISKEIKKRFSLDLKLVSGGNSSSLHLLDSNKMPEGINNLRLGESLVLGRETAYGKNIPGCHQDAFTLKAEIIEMKVKPTVPIGNIGKNAFGEVPTFVDRGKRKVAILGIGKQDVDIESLLPHDDKLIILGASSDHMIVDINDSNEDYKLGSTISFNLTYGGILKTMTSSYVQKEFIK